MDSNREDISQHPRCFNVPSTQKNLVLRFEMKEWLPISCLWFLKHRLYHKGCPRYDAAALLKLSSSGSGEHLDRRPSGTVPPPGCTALSDRRKVGYN